MILRRLHCAPLVEKDRRPHALRLGLLGSAPTLCDPSSGACSSSVAPRPLVMTTKTVVWRLLALLKGLQALVEGAATSPSRSSAMSNLAEISLKCFFARPGKSLRFHCSQVYSHFHPLWLCRCHWPPQLRPARSSHPVQASRRHQVGCSSQLGLHGVARAAVR